MPFDSNAPSSFTQPTWADFKVFIDGTTASLAYQYFDDGIFYRIVTEPYIGIAQQYFLFKDSGADQLDFETNFKNLALRKPGSFVTYLGTGVSQETTLTKLTISQGSTLGSNTQVLMGGSVSTLAPTYTTGNINPLSLTTSGLLRIDGSGVTQPVSGTITSNQGTSNTLANAWATKITDTTNGPVAVKGASTAALATDSALVVAVSPNNSITITQATAANLNAQVVGPGASGAAISGNPVRIAGSDGTNTRNVITDTTGRLTMVGAAASGAAVSGNPVLVSGQDGTNVRTIKTDTTGRIEVAVTGTSSSQVEGKASDGYAPSGNPVFIAGYDGVNVQAILTDSDGRIITATPNSAVATSGFIFGAVPTSGSAQIAIEATTYTEQSSNAQRSIVSANANDTSAGTGARQVKITYYTSTGTGPFTETVTLNGITPVNTVATNICFIEKMEVTSVGSGGVNAGIISLKASTGGGGVTIGSIGINTSITGAGGDNITLWAHHYVPVGKTCFITGILTGHNSNTSLGSGGLFHLKSTQIGVANAPNIQISDFIHQFGQDSSTSRIFPTPIQVVGPARITAYVLPDASLTVNYHLSFDFYEQ